jgi:surfeit locus 1 family protein|tara:strand:- start:1130 stop:1747 length:618 start_codon:yes stop_codon:yes gene_type:complete
LFCALGTWQLVRLQWKNNLINQISKGLESSAISYSNKIQTNYQRVYVNGEYDFEKQVYLYSLNEKGEPGYDVITPFKTMNSENILINRGWIKTVQKNENIINKNTNKKIQGLLLKNLKKNIFKPDNEINKNIWFSINMADIKKFTGKTFNEYILYLEDESINTPKPKQITIDLPNNHFKYALTWYSISISIFGYFLYFRKKNEIL